jgi:hypothetical protein
MSTTMGFDLDRFIRTSGRVDLSGVEWHRVHESPITPEEIRVLRYMMDIESHTVIFLRDLLATHAAFDPDVTAFLSCWNYEEYWHGEAFSRLLGEAGVPIAPDPAEMVGYDVAYPTRRLRIRSIRRALWASGYLGHLGALVGSAVSGREFIAVPMTWGMVNELTTARAYRRIVATTGNVPLRQILQAIGKQERRHFAFYKAQADFRLRRSARARRLVRFAMDRLWEPVGTGVRPQADTDFTVCYTFNDPEGTIQLDEMDAAIEALPGLAGTAYLRSATRDAARRMGLAFGRERPRISAAPRAEGAGQSRRLTRVPSAVSITSSPNAVSSSRRRSLSA